MILTDQPKTFVICFENKKYNSVNGIKNQKNSKQFYDILEHSLNLYNWHWEIFPAIDGHDANEEFWKETTIKFKENSKFNKKLGTKGCFASHFLLWNKCIELDEPIVILEHDAVITSKWREIEIDDELLKLGYLFKVPRHDKTTGAWVPGAWAYVIVPSVAKQLVIFCQENYAVPVDKLFGSKVIKWRFIATPVCRINVQSLPLSTTNGKNDNVIRIS